MGAPAPAILMPRYLCIHASFHTSIVCQLFSSPEAREAIRHLHNVSAPTAEESLQHRLFLSDA
jgi:hypothetical protein